MPEATDVIVKRLLRVQTMLEDPVDSLTNVRTLLEIAIRNAENKIYDLEAEVSILQEEIAGRSRAQGGGPA